MIDREAWADAYRFHQAAIETMPTMDITSYWVWFHATEQQISGKHGDTPLIQNLLVAVYEDVEAADSPELHRPTPAPNEESTQKRRALIYG